MKNRIVILILCLTCLAHAQRNDSIPHNYVSFGVKVAKDFGTEYYFPVRSTLIVQSDPLPWLRADVNWGMNNYMQQWNQDGRTFELKFKSNQYATGLYGVYKQERVKAYLGYRFTFTDVIADYLKMDYDQNGNATYTVMQDKYKLSGHSAVLGGEYFFGNNFSLGAEFSFSFFKGKYLPAPDPDYVSPYSDMRFGNTATDGSMILRFYFLRKNA